MRVTKALWLAAVACTLPLVLSCLPFSGQPAHGQAGQQGQTLFTLRSWSDSTGILKPPPENISLDWRRKIYSYSVVPGGVYTKSELKTAIEEDPRVARHYRDLDLARVDVERLPRAGFYYASYSMDGQIYWTGHRINVQKGEPVLSDGKRMIRARCGNQLSETPKTPLAPRSKEPEEKDFEFGEFVPMEELLTSHRGSFVMPPLWLPLLLVIPPHHPGVKPVVVVPEPDTILLVGSGLILLGAAAALRRKSGPF